MASEPASGKIILGRYRLDAVLGEGGMGIVWSATQLSTGQPVALKFLKNDPGSDDVYGKRRFAREARAAAAVRHPNVVLIHDVLETEDGEQVIVMERLFGEPLAARLARERRLGTADFARIMAPAVSAIGTAHAHGVVHRDLKPPNIFLTRDGASAQGAASTTPDGDAESVKVFDFGVAKLLHPDADPSATGALTDTGSMLGTPHYMSPEQAFGERDIDHRSDIWALGIIFYRCLSGTLPTRADNVGQILKIIISEGIPPLESVAPDVPADLATMVGRMLQRDRDKRPQDLREVLDTLRRYTNVAVPSFGAPSAPSVRTSARPPLLDEQPSYAPTPRVDFPRTVETLDASDLAETKTLDAHMVRASMRAPALRSGRTTVWLLGVALCAGLLAAGWAMGRGHTPTEPMEARVPATAAPPPPAPSELRAAVPVDAVVAAPSPVASPAASPAPTGSARHSAPARGGKAHAPPTSPAAVAPSPASQPPSQPNVFVDRPPF